MIVGTILIPFTVLALGLSGFGAGAAAAEAFTVPGAAAFSAAAEDTAKENDRAAAQEQNADPQDTKENAKEESGNAYKVFSTEAVGSMSTLTIDGKKYTIPIKEKQLKANGWTVSEQSDKTEEKSKDKSLTVSKGDRKFSAQEDKSGNIARLVESSAGTDAVVLPGGIKSGMEEKELLARLKTIPLPWKSTNDKKNAKTKNYLITVPLLSGQGYPACDYEITVEDGKVSTIGIGMVAECGSEGWPAVVLGYRAADHYQTENKEMPPFYGFEEEDNKDISVRLYEDFEDHIATLGMFRMDRSGKGYDLIGDPEAAKIIDFIKR